MLNLRFQSVDSDLLLRIGFTKIDLSGSRLALFARTEAQLNPLSIVFNISPPKPSFLMYINLGKTRKKHTLHPYPHLDTGDECSTFLRN